MREEEEVPLLKVHEIWDKNKKRVIFLADGVGEPLRVMAMDASHEKELEQMICDWKDRRSVD